MEVKKRGEKKRTGRSAKVRGALALGVDFGASRDCRFFKNRQRPTAGQGAVRRGVLECHTAARARSATTLS